MINTNVGILKTALECMGVFNSIFNYEGGGYINSLHRLCSNPNFTRENGLLTSIGSS